MARSVFRDVELGRLVKVQNEESVMGHRTQDGLEKRSRQPEVNVEKRRGPTRGTLELGFVWALGAYRRWRRPN